jgi:hypothetical protein
MGDWGRFLSPLQIAAPEEQAAAFHLQKKNTNDIQSDFSWRGLRRLSVVLSLSKYLY